MELATASEAHIGLKASCCYATQTIKERPGDGT